MESFLFGIMVAAAPQLICSAALGAPACDDAGTARCVVLAGDLGGRATGSGLLRCITTGTNASGRLCRAVSHDGGVVLCGLPGGGDKDGQVKIITKVKIVKDSSLARGWLGVAVGTVPEALAVQLGADRQGIIILNVVDDSPADEIGLEVHDVILSVDGKLVAGERTGDIVTYAASLIGANAPGKALDIVVLRNGIEMTFAPTLSTRPDSVGMSWKVDLEPLAEIEEHVQAFGRMMTQDEDGKWIVQDLGALTDGDSILHQFKRIIPQVGTKTMRVTIDGNRESISTTVQQGEFAITVDQDEDGAITVTREGKNGVENVVTYTNADELKADDEEAYELLGTGENQFAISLRLEDMEGLHGFHAGVDADVEVWVQRVEAWQGDMEKRLQEAMESLDIKVGEHGDALHALFLNAHDGAAIMPSGGKVLLRQLSEDTEIRQSFEVRPDGTIEIRIRKGDSELVRLFTDEDDLASRDETLYEKYAELMEASR